LGLIDSCITQLKATWQREHEPFARVRSCATTREHERTRFRAGTGVMKWRGWQGSLVRVDTNALLREGLRRGGSSGEEEDDVLLTEGMIPARSHPDVMGLTAEVGFICGPSCPHLQYLSQGLAETRHADVGAHRRPPGHYGRSSPSPPPAHNYLGDDGGRHRNNS